MTESTKDRYRLGPNLFKLSREKKDIQKALEEWELVNHELNEDKNKKFHCICNSWPWAKKDTYYNPFTKNVIEVGSGCSDKFKKHAKPAMSNAAARDMLNDIMRWMTAAEKLEYTDIANMLAYCQNAIQNLVAHVDAKLRDGTPLALQQLIECLTGILQRQEELYLPTENIATLLQKLKARLVHLEEQAAAAAAAREQEAAKQAKRQAEHEAWLQSQKVAAEERAAREAAEAEAREAAAAVRREREATERKQREAEREAERREREENEAKERQERQERMRIAEEMFAAERQGLIYAAEQRQRERIQKIIERQAAKKK
jgi:hypothetical protein